MIRAALAPLLLLAPALAVPAAERVVLVPFDAVARTRSARAIVMPHLEAALDVRGHAVVSGEEVERFLHRERIRHLDSIPAPKLAALLDELDAEAAVLGAILTWDAAGPEPRVALSARMVGRDGRTLWSAVAGLSAAETERAFGLGRAPDATALSRRVISRLLETLPQGRPGGPRSGKRAVDLPRVYRSPETAGTALRICLLPLENRTEQREAPRVVEEILQHRLGERPGLTVVPPADLRGAIVSAGLRAPSLLSRDQLRSLSSGVGTSLFLRGAILGFGAGPDGSGIPEVELHLTLLDAESGRTLWSGVHRRGGLDYEGLLGLGAVREPAALASQVVAELVGAFTRP